MINEQKVIDYFAKYKHNIYSQYGEDGVIAELLRIIGIDNGIAVDIGAWDGIKFSNVKALVDRGYGATMIEADEDKFKTLEHNYRDNPSVRCIRDIITSDNAAGYFLDWDYPVLNIDIDGGEADIWKAVGARAVIAVIEWNDRGNKSDEKVEAAADELGYFKVSQTNSNMIFVRNDYRRTVMTVVLQQKEG